jgi:hypothetical protein
MKVYDAIGLQRPLKEVDIPVGSHGVVLMVFETPTLAYEVEFVDCGGNSLGTSTVTEDQIAASASPS